jgi:hypothetical protein
MRVIRSFRPAVTGWCSAGYRAVTGDKEAPARRPEVAAQARRRGILVALGGLALWEKAGRRKKLSRPAWRPFVEVLGWLIWPEDRCESGRKKGRTFDRPDMIEREYNRGSTFSRAKLDVLVAEYNWTTPHDGGVVS